MEVVRRIVVFGCGVLLIVLGFAGYSAGVGEIVIGLILVGALSGDLLVKVVSGARKPRGDSDDVPAG